MRTTVTEKNLNLPWDKLKGHWNLAGGTGILWKAGEHISPVKESFCPLPNVNSRISFPSTDLKPGALCLEISDWAKPRSVNCYIQVMVLSQPLKQGGPIQAAHWEWSLAHTNVCYKQGIVGVGAKNVPGTVLLTEPCGRPTSNGCAHVLMCFGPGTWWNPTDSSPDWGSKIIRSSVPLENELPAINTAPTASSLGVRQWQGKTSSSATV